MKTIYLDTNFLMAVYQFKVDVFSEIDRILEDRFELCVLDVIVDELETLSQDANQHVKAAARYALQLVADCQVVPTEGGHADDLLVGLVKEDVIICTQDVALKKRVKTAGGQVLTIKQQKFVTFG